MCGKCLLPVTYSLSNAIHIAPVSICSQNTFNSMSVFLSLCVLSLSLCVKSVY